MNKERQAVVYGFIISVTIAAILTVIWAVLFHFFPNVWGWVKTLSAFLNYSFALYIGILSASLRTKALGINAPLYVMLMFFALTVILRMIFVADDMQWGMTLLKFVYSIILLSIAFKHAQQLQGSSYSSQRRYGNLR